jgi:exopolyphosphatase/guanosine-5'-triphosphate,3'-diphosphate pyrophosphatase
MAEVVAAIDCGTNTARLLVRGDDGDLVRREVITRLGAGLERSGRIGDDALGRLRDALAGFGEEVRRHGANRVEVVATSAARDAANRDDLLRLISEVIGVDARVLDGAAEAALSFAGATHGLDPSLGPFCVIDIGGGSTEFAVGTDAADHVMSLEMGSVRFTERYVESDPPAPEELVACLSVAEAHLSDLVREVPAVADVATYLGVAGTVVTMAAVEIGCEPDAHDLLDGFELTREAAEDVFRTLVTETLADRRHNPGLHPDRAEAIVGGAALVVATMRYLSIDALTVSTHDLLDALVASPR